MKVVADKVALQFSQSLIGTLEKSLLRFWKSELTILPESYWNNPEQDINRDRNPLTILPESYWNLCCGRPAQVLVWAYNSPRVLLEQAANNSISLHAQLLTILPESYWNLFSPSYISLKSTLLQFSQSLIGTPIDVKHLSKKNLTYNSPRVLLERLPQSQNFRER